MKIFLDTNILVDFLVDRKPWSDSAIEIFRHALTENITLYTSSISVTNCAFILRPSTT